jgi:hypothetical protein
MKRFAVEIVGKVPLLMHRYVGEQPSMIKAPRGKKMQEHIDAARERDWRQAAYYRDGSGWHIPPENIEAALASGAMKFRMGKDFKAAVAVEDDFIPLLVPNGGGVYAPATKPLMSYYVPDHIDTRGVVIQKSRIDRTRPIFREWGLQFTIISEDEISEKQIYDALDNCQIGDFRPRFGRFMVKALKQV